MRYVDPREKTLRMAGLAPVRRTECIGEARNEVAMVPPGTGADDDALRPVLADHAPELVGNDVVGLVPADPCPASLPPRTQPLHRKSQAVRVMNDIDARGSLQAQPAFVQGRLGIAGHALDRPVDDVHQNAAAAMAHAAGALIDLGRSGIHECPPACRGALPGIRRPRLWERPDADRVSRNTKWRKGSGL